MNAVALISDLHANLVALDAVLADIGDAAVDQIVCLGDIVDLGPEPQATVQRLRERNVPCILGNHDPLDEGPSIPMLADIERWTKAQLDESSRLFLRALPAERVLDLDGTEVLCVHGSPQSFRHSLLVTTPESEIEEWTRSRQFDVLACGHTHVPLTRFHGKRVLVNTGSVGMPFSEPFTGTPPRVLRFSDYAILRSRRGRGGGTRLEIEHRRIPLDFEALTRSVRRTTFPHADEWLGQWI